MSIEDYSQELKDFFRQKITILNDEKFPPKDKLAENLELILTYIENTINYDQIECIFFYVSYFMEDELFRNTVIKLINDKYNEKNVKAREMPEKHYIIVYKICAEEYLNANIQKIKNYYEDFLKQTKKAEEYIEMKKKLEEEEKIKELNLKKKMERFILPKISYCDIQNITTNSAEITVPLYNEKDLIEKNINNITNCEEEYKNEKLEYVIYLFNKKQNKYEKKLFKKNPENISGNYFKIKLENLEQNTIYIFLAGIKFANTYSNVTANKFNFITASNPIQGRIFSYGEQNNNHNLLSEDNKVHIQLPSNFKDYYDCFENNKSKIPLLLLDNIQSFSASSKKTCTIIEGGYVIQSGNTYFVSGYDYSEGNFPNNEKISIDDENLEILMEDFPPYMIEFPNNIKLKKICVSDKHCLALSTLGECYSWGDNYFGQIGNGGNNDEIIGNPTKINFDIFDSDGHKYISKNKPIFYDIAVGNDFSLALGTFNDKKILYHWGNGAGVANEVNLQNKISVKSNHPVPLTGVDNIIKIFAKDSSIGILSWDKEKKINVLYIHGLQKFGIDANFGNYGKQKPVIVNFFRDEGISVLYVNFSNNCMCVIGCNTKKENKVEVYLRGNLTNDIFGYKEYKNNFMKLDKEWSENVLAIAPRKKSIFFLLKGGLVKKVWNDGKDVKEKDIKIEGYDLEKFITDDIEKVKFYSFGEGGNDNFMVFYHMK